MSGIKTTYTTISDNELRLLRQRAAQATNLQQANQLLNQLGAKNDAALADYRNRINNMNATIDQLNQRLAQQGAAATKEAQALRQQLRDTVRESNDRMQAAMRKSSEQMRVMQNSFHEELAQTRQDVADTIDANNRRIEAALRQTSQHLSREMEEMQDRISKDMAGLQSQLDSVETVVRASAENQGVLLDMAREYSRMAQELLADIQDNYRAELLCPGRLTQVRATYETGDRDIALAEKIPENSSTARASARQALEAAMTLHQDVIRAEQEWALHYQVAKQTLNTAQVQLEASRFLDLPEEGDVSVDVDRWTDGDLSAIESRLGALDRQLENAEGLSLKDLDGVQAAGLQISREVDDASLFALEAFFASQDRGEIAQDIANQLYTHGLTVLDHCYQGSDQRSAHRLHLINRVTGLEIVITQVPESRDGTIVNRLESDILNYGSLNAEYGDQIARSVLSSLSELGFEQTEVKTAEGFEHMPSNRQEFADMQQWRTEQTPEIVKPTHRNTGKTGT